MRTFPDGSRGPLSLLLPLLAIFLAILPVTAHAQMAVAGQASGPGVRVIDVSVPATPVLRGMVNTTLVGISSIDRKSTRLNSSHGGISRMPSSA